MPKPNDPNPKEDLDHTPKDELKDKELGMDRGITRRDFLNGVAVTAGAATFPPHLLAAIDCALDPEKASGYDPPALNGLRGSHVGSFEVAHSLRDHNFWKTAGKPVETGERFDLVVVGGGISGLSAAHFFRKANPSARVLVLDNHDDFGGHAKRNEFTAGGRTLLGYVGEFFIVRPPPYSAVAQGLIEELGIHVPDYPKYASPNLYPPLGLAACVYFHKKTFCADVVGANPLPSR